MIHKFYKNRNFKIGASILLVVLIGSIYISANQSKLFANCFSNQAGPVNIVMGEVNQENVHLKYPQVEGLADAQVENKINAQIENEIRIFKEPVEGTSHSVDSHYSLEFNKNNILSLTLLEFHYRTMMAHPMHYMKAMTMNTKTGQVYQLIDLFKTSSDYQTRLTMIINQQIATKGLHLFKPFEGIKTDQEFYLTPDGVVIYYQLYYYTPYVYGFLKFNIPYEQVADIMQRDFIQ